MKSYTQNVTLSHSTLLRACLDLALVPADTGNGARVGAVLASESQIIAIGRHEGYGKAHAEADLFACYTGPIGPRDTLYVNLEPCCHTGKTPPCTDAIIKSGITRVVYGMQDPDPRVSGKGIAVLRKAGIEVIGPVERALSEWVNRGFMTVRTKNRPWITVKHAFARNGAVAKPDGTPLKITSSEQDQLSHTFLRKRHDAILVGIGTVLRDNPTLNTRNAQDFRYEEGIIDKKLLNTKVDQFQPYRIVLDPQLRTPSEAKLVTDNSADRTILCVSEETYREKKDVCDLFTKRGVRIFPIATSDDGSFLWPSLWTALLTPTATFFGITSMLVEGGPGTWAHFVENGMMDMEVTLRGA